LIGKKAAKAHMAAKETTKRNATPINFNQPVQSVKATKVVESDDEDEGRTAAFQSKRQRTKKRRPVPVDSDDPEAREEVPETELPHRPVNSEEHQEEPILEADLATAPMKNPGVDESGTENTNFINSRKSKATKRSYLDEILAERSKKHKGKKRNQEKVSSGV
jgi:hypothetical protein